MPPDQTLNLLRHGYLFTALQRLRGARRDQSDVMTLRLLGRLTTVVRGPSGVRFFYDVSVVHRAKAMPAVVARPLFGRGAVHGLDGAAHDHRKAMFVDLLMDRRRVDPLLRHADHLLAHALEEWEAAGRGCVYDTAVAAYGRAVIRWAGIDERPDVELRRAVGMARIVDGFGTPGVAYAAAYRERVLADRWATRIVRDVRAGTRTPPPGSVLERLAAHADEQGHLLDAHTAGVELLNVLRPTVAVARLAAFLAIDLLQQPDWHERIRDEVRHRDDAVGGPLATAFAQEVRRLAPFVPMLAAVTSRPTRYAGQHLPEGRRVLLDVVGTNRDHGSWPDPHTFDPARFIGTGAEWSDHFVPQGGGRPETGHRCPGELVAVGLLGLTASRLALLDVTPTAGQDLGWSWQRMPTMPRSGVILDVRSAANVERCGAFDEPRAEV